MRTAQEIAKTIDHAVLKPNIECNQLTKELAIALKYNVASICVYPTDIIIAHDVLRTSSVKIGTVIDFPFGRSTTQMRIDQAVRSIRLGADELDIVIRQDLINKSCNVWEDLDWIKKSIYIQEEREDIIFKAILETCYLEDDRVEDLSKNCFEAGMNFIKTSTGFGSKGAEENKVRLMRDVAFIYHGSVKASGGIKTLADVEKFLDLGCTRIGTSSTESIMQEAINRDKKQKKEEEKKRIFRFHKNLESLNMALNDHFEEANIRKDKK